jgi:hypothetical protein
MNINTIENFFGTFALVLRTDDMVLATGSSGGLSRASYKRVFWIGVASNCASPDGRKIRRGFLDFMG